MQEREVAPPSALVRTVSRVWVFPAGLENTRKPGSWRMMLGWQSGSTRPGASAGLVHGTPPSLLNAWARTLRLWFERMFIMQGAASVEEPDDLALVDLRPDGRAERPGLAAD